MSLTFSSKKISLKGVKSNQNKAQSHGSDSFQLRKEEEECKKEVGISFE